ncbi:MAG: hypothetical protein HXX20_16400 [Chloroflexi bacterium]|nr:hypothetical protein [Chloroflexota bacterium]
MTPIVALILVVLLVGSLAFYRRFRLTGWQIGKQFAVHLGQSGLAGLLVWLLNVLTGWGPVHTLDSLLAGLGVLVSAGLGLGLVSGLALYFEEGWTLLWHKLPNRGLRSRRRRFKARPTVPFRTVALPLPDKSNRLDWCPECLRWHSAEVNHKHSNLAG